MMITIFLTTLISLGVAAGVFYLLVLRPAGQVERWMAAVANEEALPQRPAIGWCFWLHPIHRECLAAGDKIREIRLGTEESRSKLEKVEFLQHFILGSLIEGVMVLDQEHRITLVNSEFLNLFRLVQSPLQSTLIEIMGDDKLDEMVATAFRSGQVVSGRISKVFNSEGGRPPVFEVSVVPVHSSPTTVGSVVVLFLPPPDRPRMVQILKRHGEKLHRLASEWTQRGGAQIQKSVTELAMLGVALGEVEESEEEEAATVPVVESALAEESLRQS